MLQPRRRQEGVAHHQRAGGARGHAQRMVRAPRRRHRGEAHARRSHPRANMEIVPDTHYSENGVDLTVTHKRSTKNRARTGSMLAAS